MRHLRRQDRHKKQTQVEGRGQALELGWNHRIFSTGEEDS